jgi:hypothetical protein
VVAELGRSAMIKFSAMLLCMLLSAACASRPTTSASSSERSGVVVYGEQNYISDVDIEDIKKLVRLHSRSAVKYFEISIYSKNEVEVVLGKLKDLTGQQEIFRLRKEKGNWKKLESHYRIS